MAIRRGISELEAKRARTEEKRTQLDWAEKTLRSLREDTAPRSIFAEVQLMRLGADIAFFAIPGEPFVEVGLKLKRKMDLPGSFVVAYANGSLGYLPSRRAEEDGWCKHDDTYRLLVGLLFPANFSGAIEDKLIGAAEGLLKTTLDV